MLTDVFILQRDKILWSQDHWVQGVTVIWDYAVWAERQENDKWNIIVDCHQNVQGSTKWNSRLDPPKKLPKNWTI